ncbi:hypothetical protein [Streptomyces sp. TRM70350]|uniref:vWA domain-containing protein n=1 Tax=Streptomyces sp. TRM70350 TaxID=2856165 RepID=UPI00210F8A8A|nr:hypothetical protein [Streptomyces sp. TRM70350]
MLRSAIQRLTTGAGTAIGDAVVAARDAVRALDERAGTEPPPAHIVLLSDGSNTTGRSWSRRPGRRRPTASRCRPSPTARKAARSPSRPAKRAGPRDGPALERLASTTGGAFHETATGEELQAVYEDIGSSVGHRTEEREIWQWLVAAGLLTALLAAATSLLWFSRIP